MFKKYTRGALSLFFAVGFLLIGTAYLPAQTAAELQSVLAAPAVTCAQAARFVIASSESAPSNTSGSAAARQESYFRQAMEKGWLPQGTTSDEKITLGKLSFLMMKAFDIKGGFMYSIFPVQRYAFRTMVSRSFIQGAADPDMTVTGERFLQILGNVTNAEGGES